MRTSLLAPLLAAMPLLAIPTTCGARRSPSTEEQAPVMAPRARLRISGFLQGQLEPCGCASGQLGGLPRRVFNLKQEHDYDLLIEGGNLVAGNTPLDIMKLTTTLEVLTMPGTQYDALGIGPLDVQLPTDELAGLLHVLPIHGISSDIVASKPDRWPVKPYLERAIPGGATVRIAALTLALPNGPGFELLAPEAAWKRALEGAADSTLRVLLVHGAPAVARAQARLEPQPDLIVGVTDEVSEPPGHPEPVGEVPVVFPGTHGRMMLDIILTRLQGRPQITKYRIVELAGSETAPGALEDNNTKLALLFHRQMVKADGILEKMADLKPTPTGAHYVGNDFCADCHEEAAKVWKGTAHAHAWRTLEKAEKSEKYGWPVTAYPDCVGCHTVGYGYMSGFVDPQKTPDLRNVGCEQCHGPGSVHIESEDPADIARGDVDTCLQCHTHEQSPLFADDYAGHWKKIKH